MPDFEPGTWNADPEVQSNNNCYDYATNRPSGRKEKPRSVSRPGKKAGKEMKRSPYSCEDIMTGVEADVKAAGAGKKADKDENCGEGCWKVAVMRAVLPDKTNTDFHFVRQDSGGGWSQKQGTGPAKDTDDNGNKIADPAKAKIDNYEICGYFCFCPGMQVAVVTPTSGHVFAALTLKGPAVLATASLDLELPAGRLTLLYDHPPARPSMTATVSIFSGEEDPFWHLGPEEVDVVRSKLQHLARTDRRPRYRAGYQGIFLDTDLPGLPSRIHVLEGLLSVRHGQGTAEWYEDVHRLEKWLIERALSQPFGRAERAMIEHVATSHGEGRQAE